MCPYMAEMLLAADLSDSGAFQGTCEGADVFDVFDNISVQETSEISPRLFRLW